MGLFVFVFVLWLVSWFRAPVETLFCSFFGVLVNNSFPNLLSVWTVFGTPTQSRWLLGAPYKVSAFTQVHGPSLFLL